MIIVEVVGGLGNQMFIYACGRRLAEKHKTELLLDLRSYYNYKFAFALDKFNIKAKINDQFDPWEFREKLKIANVMYGRKKAVYFDGIRPVEQYKGAFNPEILDMHDNVFLFGYWGSYKYFEDIEDILREEFTLKEPLDEKAKLWSHIIKSEKMPVSLHIRRGDYVESEINRKIYVQLPVDYYYSAVDRIREIHDISALFVFSNDISWCKEWLKFDIPVYYVEGTDDDHGYEDMYLMSLCRHNILANSTFSWWGGG